MATKPCTLASTTAQPQTSALCYQHKPHTCRAALSTLAHLAHGTSTTFTASVVMPSSQQALVGSWDPLGSYSQVLAFPACAPATRGTRQHVAAKEERDGSVQAPTQLLALGTAMGHPGGPCTPLGAHNDGMGMVTGTGSHRAGEQHLIPETAPDRKKVPIGPLLVPGMGAQPPCSDPKHQVLWPHHCSILPRPQ